ncbi:MAG: NADH-quinone oxidoreductase subunit M [Acidimicrobiia bacterium]
MNSFPILSVLIFTPIVGALVILCTSDRRPDLARALGIAFSMATLGLAAWLLFEFSARTAGFQFTETHTWFQDLGVDYRLGVDGISVFMVVLNALLFPIGLLASFNEPRTKQFFVWMLVLEGAVMGVFLSLDLIMFFVFFELVLVPMYFLIAGWGHGRKVYAATKFFIFTMAGSAFLLVGILVLAYLHRNDTRVLTFSFEALRDWAPKGLSSGTAKWLFVAFGIAFAVKVPLFPLHTWLPDAHTEAPTAGSVILAGVLLKMGTYGFLRFSLGFFPGAAVDLAWVLLVLGVIGIVYGAIVAAVQPDLKRLIAYSSVAHLGFVMIGIFALTRQGLAGGVFTMVSHGLTTGALFLLVGILYERRHTRKIADFGGLWKSIPVFSAMFVIAMFASIGLPGLSGFVGEFLALLGTFLANRWIAVVATTGVILAAVYLLWAFQRAFTGEPEGENVGIRDIKARELLTVVPLLALSLFLGFYPKPVLDRVQPSLQNVIERVERTTDYREPKPRLLPGTSEAKAKAETKASVR